jgi:hypothetical protein
MYFLTSACSYYSRITYLQPILQPIFAFWLKTVNYAREEKFLLNGKAPKLSPEWVLSFGFDYQPCLIACRLALARVR